MSRRSNSRRTRELVGIGEVWFSNVAEIGFSATERAKYQLGRARNEIKYHANSGRRFRARERQRNGGYALDRRHKHAITLARASRAFIKTNSPRLISLLYIATPPRITPPVSASRPSSRFSAFLSSLGKIKKKKKELHRRKRSFL